MAKLKGEFNRRIPPPFFLRERRVLLFKIRIAEDKIYNPAVILLQDFGGSKKAHVAPIGYKVEFVLLRNGIENAF